MEFYALEPFGFPERDLRHGMLCATFLAPYAQRGRAPDPSAFMLRPTPERELTPAETASMLDLLLGTGTAPAPARDDGEEE